MKIQQKNDFTLRLTVLAQGEREPISSATDVRVVLQNLDVPNARWEAQRLVITDAIEVKVPAAALGLGRHAAFVYYTISDSARFAENSAALTIVRSADEADIEGESLSADVNVAFAASGKNGLSAFELAQQAGYAGTFEEWLYAGENANNAAIAAGQASINASTAAAEAHSAAELALAAAAKAEEVSQTIVAKVDKNADAIATETERAIFAENEIENELQYQTERIDKIEPLVTENGHAIIDLQHAVQDNDAAYKDTFQDLGDDIKTAEAAAIEKGRALAKRDLFIAAGALYNATKWPVAQRAPWGELVQNLPGYYYLNGLGDITEDEMAVIYSERYRLMLLTGRDRAAQQVKVRTFWGNQVNDNIRNFYKITDPYMAFYGCANLEVLTFVASSGNFATKSTAYMPSISSTINYMLGFVADCPKLKYISALNVSDIAQMQPSWGTIPPFRGCVSLIEVSLFGLKCDVSFADSPNISKRSVLYAIENGLPTTAITITLHTDAYARLAEDTDIIAALEAQPLITLVSA